MLSKDFTTGLRVDASSSLPISLSLGAPDSTEPAMPRLSSIAYHRSVLKSIQV